MGDNIHGNKYEGDNVHGNKIVYEQNHIALDVGIIRNILQTNPNVIKESLQVLSILDNNFESNDDSIPIDEKNLLNGLESFYENFIKRIEQKLLALDKFFKENNFIDEIESASDSIKMFIFSYANRESLQLTPELFNLIIIEHTKQVEGGENKDMMKLVIFYLYRYCYIGLKENA